METKTYAGISEEYGKLSTSKIVIIPVPYDGTVLGKKEQTKVLKHF